MGLGLGLTLPGLGLTVLIYRLINIPDKFFHKLVSTSLQRVNYLAE